MNRIPGSLLEGKKQNIAKYKHVAKNQTVNIDQKTQKDWTQL